MKNTFYKAAICFSIFIISCNSHEDFNDAAEFELNIDEESRDIAEVILDVAASEMDYAERLEYYSSMKIQAITELLNNYTSNGEVSKKSNCNWYYFDTYCNTNYCKNRNSGYYPDKLMWRSRNRDCWEYWSMCGYKSVCH